MKRITIVTVLLACGFLAAGTPLFAQTARAGSAGELVHRQGHACSCSAATTSTRRSSRSTARCRRASRCPSSRCRAARTATTSPCSGRTSPRRTSATSGYANVGWFGVTFDYNQIPHNMGNNGQTLFAETAPGVWNMSATLRKALGDAVDARADRGAHLPVLRRPAGPDASRRPTASTSRACASAATSSSTSARSCRSTCRSPTCARSRRATAARAAATSSAWSPRSWTCASR